MITLVPKFLGCWVHIRQITSVYVYMVRLTSLPLLKFDNRFAHKNYVHGPPTWFPQHIILIE